MKPTLNEVLELKDFVSEVKTKNETATIVCADQDEIDAALWLITEKYDIAYSVNEGTAGSLIIGFNYRG